MCSNPQMADEMREAAGEDEMDLANEMAEVSEPFPENRNSMASKFKLKLIGGKFKIFSLWADLFSSNIRK